MRALIVDGSAQVRARLAARLIDAAVDVVEAADLGHALALSLPAAPDAIIVDVRAHAGAGILGLARLRGSAPSALIVVLTNEVDDVHRRECIRQGADFFLDKSRDFDQAVELVRRARSGGLTRTP